MAELDHVTMMLAPTPTSASDHLGLKAVGLLPASIATFHASMLSVGYWRKAALYVIASERASSGVGVNKC
jgi:hypothetical protein